MPQRRDHGIERDWTLFVKAVATPRYMAASAAAFLMITILPLISIRFFA